MGRHARLVVRIVALLAGAALFAAAAWGVLFVFLSGAIAAQWPDPAVPDGEPCCPHPDTWEEVARWSGFTLVEAVVVGTAFALATALIVRGARARWISLRRLALVPAAAVLVTADAMALGLAVPVLAH